MQGTSEIVSEQSTLGVQSSVYSVDAKHWSAPSEAADDIEPRKDRAATHATEYLRRIANSGLPPLSRKESRSA